MGLLDSVAKRLGFVRPKRRGPMGIRAFKAGDTSRLTSSWTLRDGSINAEIFQSLRVMRARSRDLFANNEFAKQFGNLAKSNIVGPMGFTFRNRSRRSDTGEIDREDNRRIEDLFRNFSKRGNFDVTGKLSRARAEALVVETLLRDGEFLLRKITGFDNPHNYALQFIDIDRLDINKNESKDPQTGNRVVMGVELDGFSRPIAYHLLTQHPEGQFLDSRSVKHTRVPADEIIHGFLPMRAEQVRGVPALHAAMIALWDTGGWREAAIINARIGANKLGFIKGPVDDVGAGQGLVTSIDDMGNQLNDSEPGEWHALPEDVEIDAWQPAYPHEMFADFNKAMIRGVAAGLGVAYFNLANDQESINFSSAKIGLMPERDMWMTMQEFSVEAFNDQYFPDWLRLQIVTGKLTPIPSTQKAFELNNRATWKGRRWQSPEPLKDAQANAIDIGMRIVSPRRIMEQRGLDADEEWRVMSEDAATLKELNIPVTLPVTVKVVEEQVDAGTNPPE